MVPPKKKKASNGKRNTTKGNKGGNGKMSRQTINLKSVKLVPGNGKGYHSATLNAIDSSGTV